MWTLAVRCRAHAFDMHHCTVLFLQPVIRDNGHCYEYCMLRNSVNFVIMVWFNNTEMHKIESKNPLVIFYPRDNFFMFLCILSGFSMCIENSLKV